MRHKRNMRADRFLTTCHMLDGETLECEEWSPEEIEQREGNFSKIFEPFESPFFESNVVSGLVNIHSRIELYLPGLTEEILMRFLELLFPPESEEMEPETIHKVRKWTRKVIIKILKYEPTTGIFFLRNGVDDALDSIGMLNLKVVSLIVQSSDEARITYISERNLIETIADFQIISESQMTQFARLVGSLVNDIEPECSAMMLQKIVDYWASRPPQLSRHDGSESAAKWTVRALLRFIVIDEDRDIAHPYLHDFLHIFADCGVIPGLLSLELPQDSIELDLEYIYLFAWILDKAPEFTEYLCSEDVKLVCWIAHEFNKQQLHTDAFKLSDMFINLVDLVCSILENVDDLGSLVVPLLPIILHDFDGRTAEEKSTVSRFAVIAMNSPDMELVEGVVMISGPSLLDMRPTSYDSPATVQYFLQTWLNLMNILPDEIAEEVRELAQDSELGDWVSSVPEELGEEREMAELLMDVLTETETETDFCM